MGRYSDVLSSGGMSPRNRFVPTQFYSIEISARQHSPFQKDLVDIIPEYATVFLRDSANAWLCTLRVSLAERQILMEQTDVKSSSVT